MHWLFFVLAIVIGGIIRAFYYQKQNKVILSYVIKLGRYRKSWLSDASFMFIEMMLTAFLVATSK